MKEWSLLRSQFQKRVPHSSRALCEKDGPPVATAATPYPAPYAWTHPPPESLRQSPFIYPVGPVRLLCHFAVQKFAQIAPRTAHADIESPELRIHSADFIKAHF